MSAAVCEPAVTADPSAVPAAAPAPRVECRVLPVDEAFQSHVASEYWRYRELHDSDREACPLQHPDVILTDLAHRTAAGLPAVTITASVGETIEAMGLLVGKEVSPRRLGGLVGSAPLRGYRLAGQGFVGAGTDAMLTSELLAKTLEHVQSAGAAFLLLEDLDVESPLGVALKQALVSGWSGYYHAGIQPRRRIALPSTTDAYWQQFSSKTRQTFRRKLKKFGTTRLDRIQTVEDVPRFLDAAHAISLQTWQTKQFGLRVSNDLATTAQLTKLAELGFLRCYLWHVDERPVAFTIGNQCHGRFHYEEVGYLTEFARHSPGQMMLIQMIDDLIVHEHADWFDFGGGDADYKALFANQSSQSGTVWLFPPTWCGRATAGYLHSCQRGRALVRSAIARSGWTTRFRQWVRYGGRKPDATSAPATESSDA